MLPSWEVNGVRYTPEALSNGNLSSQNVNKTNITVSVPVYGTKSGCMLFLQMGAISSNPAFL